MDTIKLKNYGFNALAEVEDKSISRDESVKNLMLALSKIPRIENLSSYNKIKSEKNLNDVAGIVNRINIESEPMGFVLVL
jgi:hypothetical protein